LPTVPALWGGWKTKDSGKSIWQIVLIGVLDIAACVFTVVAPGITAIGLLIVHRGLGDPEWRVQDRSVDPAAQGDHQRVAHDPLSARGADTGRT